MAKVRVNWGAAPDGISVKVYAINNTAHKTLYVVARDERSALSIAHTSNHIYSTQVKYAHSYSRYCHEFTDKARGALRDHWSAIQRAIATRQEGTLHINDVGSVFVGRQQVE